MGRRVYVLLDVVCGWVSYFLITLDLDNEDLVALLDEEVGAELTALWLVTLLPRILDPVEANGRALQPSIYFNAP